MKSKFFGPLSELEDGPALSDRRQDSYGHEGAQGAQVPQTFKSQWKDPRTNHVYEITERQALGPNADFSTEQRAREMALDRIRSLENPEVRRDRREEVFREPEAEPDTVDLETKFRERALREARFELSMAPTNEKAPNYEDDRFIMQPERPFNMRGFNEDKRNYQAPVDVLLHGIGTAESRPRPEALQGTEKQKPENVHISKDKVAFKAIFRNMMATVPNAKNRTGSVEVSQKAETESLIRGILDAGLDKAWNSPDHLRDARPDSIAVSVGKRALESVTASRSIPELTQLSTSERDSLILSIGRAMLNLAVTAPNQATKSVPSNQESPLINDIVKKKVLACMDPVVVMKALGPELSAMVYRNENAPNKQVRAPEGNTQAKRLPSTVSATKSTVVEPSARANKPTMETFFRDTTTDIKEEIIIQKKEEKPVLDLSFMNKRQGKSLVRMFTE